MALYSGSLKTHILDDVSFNQNRVEFRFDADTMYYSNIRLVDLGVKGTATSYNPLAGVYGCIKHIRLLDGRKEIDSMRFANRYLAWNNLLASNSHNRDYEGRLTKNEVGYSMAAEQVIIPGCTPNPASKDESSSIDAAGLVASLGSLDLRKCLPILNKLMVLDTALFENLKVEIEFESDARNFIVEQSNASTKIACLLIADEITDPKLQEANRRAMGPIVWNTIDHDSFLVPDNKVAAGALAADGDSLVQSVSHKVNGFDNRVVDRMVMMKCYSDKTKDLVGTAVSGFGNMGSKVQFREKVNVTKNGGRLFAGDGLEKNAISGMLADTFGSINIAPFQDKTAVGLDNKHDNSAHSEGVEARSTNDQNNKTGQAAYIGFSLQDRINDLQIEYERTNLKDTETVQKYNEGLEVHLYGECSKTFIPVKGGNYLIKYN